MTVEIGMAARSGDRAIRGGTVRANDEFDINGALALMIKRGFRIIRRLEPFGAIERGRAAEIIMRGLPGRGHRRGGERSEKDGQDERDTQDNRLRFGKGATDPAAPFPSPQGERRRDSIMIGRIFAAHRLVGDGARVGDREPVALDENMVDHPRTMAA